MIYFYYFFYNINMENKNDESIIQIHEQTYNLDDYESNSIYITYDESEKQATRNFYLFKKRLDYKNFIDTNFNTMTKEDGDKMFMKIFTYRKNHPDKITYISPSYSGNTLWQYFY